MHATLPRSQFGRYDRAQFRVELGIRTAEIKRVKNGQARTSCPASRTDAGSQASNGQTTKFWKQELDAV
jgi:hypothetical protein